jgi:outer membrane protein
MKKGSISIIINIVLAAAVIVLYVLHFQGSTTDVGEVKKETRPDSLAGDLQIVYVNMDTLLQNYDKFFDLQQELSAKQEKMKAELNTKSRSYEQGVGDFQNKVSKGLVTRSRAQELERELMQEQQNLLQLRESLTAQLAEEEMVMNRQIMYSITDFLKEYSANKDYKYILSNTFGGPLLYTEDALNITWEVIEGLNTEYNASKEEEETE